MSLHFYMFHSILNTFVFGFLIVGKKTNYFHGWGVPPPPFAENSAKMINLIFATFPKLVEDQLRKL